MITPEYENGSIVNLSSSILDFYGQSSPYKPLSEFDVFGKTRNLILLVIDGLGYEYLTTSCKDTFLYSQLARSLTSVFPSTTASAMTSFSTGLAPQQHGITGWFMWLKELGVVSAVLPFRSRLGGANFTHQHIARSDLFTHKSIVERIENLSFSVYPKVIIDGEVNKRSQSVAVFSSMSGLFKQLRHLLKTRRKESKFIFAYWDKLDANSHQFGVASNETRKHILELDNQIYLFSKRLTKLNATLLISADHGLIDTTEDKTIYLKDHPQLVNSLIIPLCGEPRAAYCYVRPSKVNYFEQYVKNELSAACELYKSSDLIDKGLFGLFEPHPALSDRVGDYILIMKDNYIIKDGLLHEKRNKHIGNHGGVSSSEMLVPLIVVN